MKNEWKKSEYFRIKKAGFIEDENRSENGKNGTKVLDAQTDEFLEKCTNLIDC